MWWRKKKKMIDIRELQKRGFKIPSSKAEIVTDAGGFIELGKNPVSNMATSQVEGAASSVSGEVGMFGFMDTAGSKGSSVGSSFGSEELRKISTQLSDLDNKIYKLEQRIELLERKAGVGAGSVGVAGW